MKKEMLREEIKEVLLNDINLLMDLVSELNCWNSCLDYLEVYNNDEGFFEEYLCDCSRMEVVRMTYYGNYNYSDDLVRFNGYGNLESLNSWQYEEELKGNIDAIIDNAEEYYNSISIYNTKLDEMFDLLVNGKW